MPKKGDKVRFNVVEYKSELRDRRRTDKVLEGRIRNVYKDKDAFAVSVRGNKLPYYVEAEDILTEGLKNGETKH